MTLWIPLYVLVTMTTNAVTGETRKDEWGWYFDYRKCEAALDIPVAVARALGNAEPGEVAYVAVAECRVEL